MGLSGEIKEERMEASKCEPLQRSEATQVIHIAVGKNYRSEKQNLKWVLENFPQARIVIIHVHRPSEWMPFKTQIGRLGGSIGRKERSITAATWWSIWLERNNRIFANKKVNGKQLLGVIRALRASWDSFC